ncbi:MULTISPECIES: type VI secretion system baseplate subunit TssG [unclassified Motilimonas]|uniref:type VI secretion system baseplate subunit TssG n=1 Tax=Motilimonas TaxID=1914248 RepID=UPI001E4D0A51|nr:MULTISPECIES: type VI secretion system baseplate subunit TssG [unclassified Motilimonas]MCE0557536.1 type VI secretion system baseplate subunit TssG [Motilimonas sp. E26]MDO6524580.1 type VI secretion system baseplate subunit TssG [Motilimonas sp. 1_MG-2023]
MFLNSPLGQQLSQHANQYDFVQVIRLLQNMAEQAGQAVDIHYHAEVMPTGSAREVQALEWQSTGVHITLAKTALSGVKGVLPDYLYSAMLNALHQDDNALKDFLDIFNQRYFEIRHQIETRTWLILAAEQKAQAIQDIHQFAGLANNTWFRYSLLMGQKSRHLGTLKQLLNDYFPYDIDVRINTFERRKLPSDALSKLSAHSPRNNLLGQGFLMGKTCISQFNHLKVFIQPNSRAQFLAIKQDQQLTRAMATMISHFLRDMTPVSIYQSVKRAYLNRPVLSSNPNKGAKLGEVDCLAPERNPDKVVHILMQ